jgi:putative transposase
MGRWLESAAGALRPNIPRWEINAKKTFRIYKELGMQSRNKMPKRHVNAKLREDRKHAAEPNDVW